MSGLLDVGEVSTNPFSPDFGQPPEALVGREQLLSDLRSGLTTGPRDARFTSLLLGPRGSGKTVVLAEMEDAATASGWIVMSADAGTGGLLDRILQSIAKARSSHDGADAADIDGFRRFAMGGHHPPGALRMAPDRVRAAPPRMGPSPATHGAGRARRRPWQRGAAYRGRDALRRPSRASPPRRGPAAHHQEGAAAPGVLGRGPLADEAHAAGGQQDDLLAAMRPQRHAPADRGRRHARAAPDRAQRGRIHRRRRSARRRGGLRHPALPAATRRPQRMDHRRSPPTSRSTCARRGRPTGSRPSRWPHA